MRAAQHLLLIIIIFDINYLDNPINLGGSMPAKLALGDGSKERTIFFIHSEKVQKLEYNNGKLKNFVLKTIKIILVSDYNFTFYHTKMSN